ncbi:MAG: DUF4115 domain-containing protein [Colwellia sp.]|nr:DUF4115 domain-containing protein [Colwellia sp.]
MSRVESPNEVLEEQTVESAEEASAELSENMEVMGPGQILAEARVAKGLTQQDVADKLNFRIALVNDIENEVFDKKLPETFNRGYLRNYAKFVNVSQEDILVSYEQLNVAKTQASELLSFSKGTEKLAESNRIKWGSYLILAILIGASAVWWMQNTTTNDETQPVKTTEKVATVEDVPAETEQNKLPETVLEVPVDTIVDVDTIASLGTDSSVSENSVQGQVITPVELKTGNSSEAVPTIVEDTASAEIAQPEVTITNVTFTFSGDCWVNISDATGERIAWGVKKLGYIMKISGQAPFNVTLGRPELVAINFADRNIDMAQFNAGNIAKFTLPITN